MVGMEENHTEGKQGIEKREAEKGLKENVVSVRCMIMNLYVCMSCCKLETQASSILENR